MMYVLLALLLEWQSRKRWEEVAVHHDRGSYLVISGSQKTRCLVDDTHRWVGLV